MNKFRWAEVREGMALAFDSLRAHKMRSFLTMLGVFIGVLSVIAMASIIEGLNRAVSGQIQSLGSNVIFVTRFKIGFQFGDRSEEERLRKPITFETGEAIAENCPAVDAVSPQNYVFVDGGNIAKYKGNTFKRPSLFGTLPDYERVNNHYVEQGRFITDIDHHFKAMVCVIGADVAEALFPKIEPIGKEILVNNHKYRVVGVMEYKKSNLGRNSNQIIVLPYGTFARLHPWEKELLLVVRSRSLEEQQLAMDQIESALRRQRGVPYNKPNDFELATQEQLLESFRSVTMGIFFLMIGISGIGLLVGGVGVMNIMLVSVKERTREIGIRKAIGAKRRNILWQFLIEAVTLSCSGGIAGILIGTGIALLIGAATPLPAAVSPLWIFIGFTVSVSVGLVFGIYPAYQAAKLDPIVSLRYE